MPADTKTNATGNHTEKTMHTAHGMTDTVVDGMKSAFDAQRKMADAFFKPFGATTNADFPTFTSLANRQMALITGMVDLVNKWATETTRLATENATTMVKAWERAARQTTGVEKTEVNRLPESARSFVTEAIDTAAKTSERMVRMGLAHAEQTRRLMDETVLSRNGN